jgi:hypothetical protein
MGAWYGDARFRSETRSRIGRRVHDTALVATIALALGSALLAGYATKRAGLPPILGYS